MKIGILGSGDVGKTLGAGLAAAGHEVMIGTRNAVKFQDWLSKAGTNLSVGSFSDAAAHGEILLLACLGKATQEVIQLAGASHFQEKVVMDATNPLEFSSGKPALYVGHTDSQGEQVQRWLPRSKVVKVFNTVGNAQMVHPSFPGAAPDMFICGNDDAAKKTVEGLCAQLGWPTLDFGGIELSRSLEELCMLWVAYGIKHGSWNHAFALLRK
jgi:predicted dinucleotide-binding enzyme